MHYCNYKKTDSENYPIADVVFDVEITMEDESELNDYEIKGKSLVSIDVLKKTLKAHFKELNQSGQCLPCGGFDTCCIKMENGIQGDYQVYIINYEAKINKIPYKTFNIIIISAIKVSSESRMNYKCCNDNN